MIKDLLKSEETFATPIVLYLVSVLGFDAIYYEPETIAEYLTKLEPTVRRSLIDRVNAALGLFTSNAFWYDPATFNIVCRALNRKPFPTNRPATIEDMAWGATEAMLLFGDAEHDDRFSEAVTRYVNYALKVDGLYEAPGGLEFAGSVPFIAPIDSEEYAYLAQQRSDREVALINQEVSAKTLQMLMQIQSLQMPLRKEASVELGELIRDFQSGGK